jgi:hypothetical protein
MTETHRRLFFAAMFALVFYLVGASFVESFVTYRTWRFVGADSFPAYYAELAPRIVRVMVLPGVVEIVLTVALLWLRPRSLPRWTVAAVLALNIVRRPSVRPACKPCSPMRASARWPLIGSCASTA